MDPYVSFCWLEGITYYATQSALTEYHSSLSPVANKMVCVSLIPGDHRFSRWKKGDRVELAKYMLRSILFVERDNLYTMLLSQR